MLPLLAELLPRPLYRLSPLIWLLKPLHTASEMQQLLSALRGNQTETNRFIGAMVGTIPIPAVFSPENIQRIVAESKQAAL